MAALSPSYPETLVRAAKTQGASAASEVSLLHLPTQVKSSMVTLKSVEGRQKTEALK